MSEKFGISSSELIWHLEFGIYYSNDLYTSVCSSPDTPLS